MLNQASISAVDAARWSRSPRFTRPLYDTYSFAQLPRLIRSLFTGGDDELQSMLLGPLAGRYDKVVLLFVDAFGWRFFQQYGDAFPFLRRLSQEGYVTKLTSQFPTTTAAHITCIHAGLPVGHSGIYEWYCYEPQLDAIIQPLLFSFAEDDKPGTLLGKLEPQALLPHLKQTLYESLATEGVRSYVFGHKSYTPSPYGNVIQKGATLVPYETLPEALDKLNGHLLSAPSPAYYYFYYGDIDTAGHKYGPSSAQFAEQVAYFMETVESRFQPVLEASKGRTLLLVTADHGQVEISPDRTTYLDIQLPEIVQHIKAGRNNRLLLPAGVARDMFLHIRDGHLDQAVSLLRRHLEGKAEVYPTTELIAEGFFGSEPPSEMFLRRVGDLVILPYAGEQVWWWDKVGARTHNFRGHHGGLTPEEMETVLGGVMRNA